VEVGEEEVEVGEGEVIEKEEEEEEEEEEVVTGPRYGGAVTIATGAEPGGFDEVYSVAANALTMKLTHQELMMGDWTLGPAGTGECDWAQRSIRKINLSTGCLAESWEFPEVGTVIFHIRDGVHFALDPNNPGSRLVNGRTLTADDVIATLTEYTTHPRAALHYGDTKFATFEKLDDMTVKMTLPVTAFDDVGILGDFASIVAPEIEEQFGLPLEWQYSCGTGAFMLTDYVPGSSITFIRNPNYWEKDPVGPGLGNQLPYLDGVKLLIISDVSTQLAAMRTAKVDILHDVGWENATDLKTRNPEILYKDFYSTAAGAIAMRTDKADLPYSKKDVRRALMMATDFETIKEEYCGGEAQILSWPICYIKEYKDAYLPLEEAPVSVQELYVYNPTRELLADAGYPDGFSASIVCDTISADYLAIIKSMWHEVDIEMDIQPQEGSIFTSIFWGKSYDELIFASPGPVANVYIAFWYAGNLLGGNMSYIDDPKCWEAKDQMMLYIMTDIARADAINRELMAYVLDQAWAIPAPATPIHHFWWPWVKNYHGEFSMGYDNAYTYTKYIWVDENLKESMGY
jgi:peptide/nickel transport system substrate-binding protein